MNNCVLAFFLCTQLIATFVDANHDNMRRRQQTIDITDEDDIICTHAVTTAPVKDMSTVLSGYGILFTISSPPYNSMIAQGNTKEMIVSSIGFYVDTTEMNSIVNDVNYEVFTLQGHYADPIRTNGGNGGLPIDKDWDYRGNFTKWEKIASGVLLDAESLISWPGFRYNDWTTAMTKNYFQIPFNEFTPVSIPEDVVQSFYITLKEVGALLYSPMETWEDLHDEQNVIHCGEVTSNNPGRCVGGDGVNIKPTIHIGEGVVSYPFTNVSYFYQPREFMGSIYYEGECLTKPPTTTPSYTTGPSLSMAPSRAPTNVPTVSTLKPTTSPTISLRPTMPYIDRGQYGCHTGISTDGDYKSFKNVTTASYGIVFPIKSNDEDASGVWITTIGFHVKLPLRTTYVLDDSTDGNEVKYEVYALIEDGMYADPNRTVAAGPPVSFDYRHLDFWNKISSGTIHKDDLTFGDYFQIPWVEFVPTYVPPNGGVRSFYVTLDSDALVFLQAKKSQLGNVQKDDNFRSEDYNEAINQHPPMLMYGEGVIGYPLHPSQFLYSPKYYIGKVFYEIDCPTSSPSFSPSNAPSISSKPSISLLPSFSPSNSPTNRPSDKPSASPSASPTDLPRYVHINFLWC